MTTEHEASRTLVKSPPELWAECSDPGSLARHLGEFGEITITRLEPENAVAWEGEHASGTVRIEPSGWGTRVTLTAQTRGEPTPVEPAVDESGPESSVETAVRADPPATAARSAEREPEPPEEVDDATLEETLEDPDPQPVAEAHRARARWRRMTARVRRAFRGNDGPAEAAIASEPDEPEEPAASEDPAASVPPPEPHFAPESEPEPEPEAEPEPEPEPVARAGAEPGEPQPGEPLEPELDAAAILTSALDSLGQAHHRPFSRA